MSLKEMTSAAPGIINNKLKSPFSFSFWFKPIFSTLPPASSLDEPFGHATFNYLSSLEPSAFPPSYFCAHCPLPPKSPLTMCSFMYSSLATCRISNHLSRFRSNTTDPWSLFWSFQSKIASPSLNVRDFDNHCPHVALLMLRLALFLFEHLNYLFLRL